MGRLEGKRIAILATDGFEQSELTAPMKALEGEGAQVDVVAPHPGVIRGWKENNWAESVDVTRALDAAKPGEYDALMLPGGVMNPDQLRSIPNAVAFVRDFVEARKPIAAICHGPWTLVETGVLEGRRVTSYGSIKTDLINAGARWTDEPVVVDRGLVTSRNPGDIPAFNEKMIEVFVAGPVPEQEEAITDENLAASPARPKRKKASAATGARGKAAPRKNGRHAKPRGTKQAPRRRATRRH